MIDQGTLAPWQVAQPTSALNLGADIVALVRPLRGAFRRLAPTDGTVDPSVTTKDPSLRSG